MAYTEKRLAELKGWMENVVEHDVERQYIKSFLKESIQQAVAEERDQAYTSLVEGIKAQVKDINGEGSVFDDFATDIIENVVKPLYGKE